METSMFKAKKISAKSYALFEDAAEFGRLTQVRDTWLLSTANADLKRLFDATVFTADATLQAILWAVRAILDHLREIAARLADANAQDAANAKFIATFQSVVNPRDGRVTFEKRSVNIGLYGAQVIAELPVLT
jgi:hypothetical protein